MASMAKGSYEFIFVWSIHNFSHLALEEDEFIESPKFVVEFLKDAEFHLALTTRDFHCPEFIGCYLHQKGDISTFYFRICIHNSDGVFDDEENENTWVYSSPMDGSTFFLLLNDLCNYLENDTLTIRCRILKKNADLPKSVMCCACTKIKVLNFDYTWKLNDFLDFNYVFQSKINKTTEIPTYSPGIPAFKIHLLDGQNFEEDAFHFAIESSVNSRTFFLVCVIHLLDANGSVAHSVKGRTLFEKSTTKQVLDLPFLSKPKLLSNEDLYLPSGYLTLRCEFSISTNDVEYEINSIKCRDTYDIQIKTPQKMVAPDGHEIWKGNAQKFFAEGRYSDFIIRSADKDFPVHKAILCAQSEVFCAMFEHDMKERNTGVVEIEDLENDVISRLWMYVYTNTLTEDVGGPTAQKLYFAAVRYGISALQRICSSYLVDHIDASNACELLVLADMHQDQELKSRIEDFIFENACDIVDSGDWKKIMETHPYLTSETMQRMFCKKMILKP